MKHTPLSLLRTRRRPITALMITLLTFWQIGQPLSAAILSWDTGNGDGVTITDGTGTWQVGQPNWNNAGVDGNWIDGNDAVFGGGSSGSAGTVSLGSAITAGSLTFNTPFTGNYIIDTSTSGLTLNTGITANESATIQSGVGGSLILAANNTWSVASGKTLTVSSGIDDGTGTFALTKMGAGTLDIQGNSTATLLGALNVGGGTLKLSGSGALGGVSAVTLSNRATLTLDNTATNLGNRLSGGAFTSNGGTLNFTHGGAAATNYAETIGAVTLNAGALTINTSQAASGQTSVLTIPSLTRNVGGTLYAAGTGLGADTRNQIILTTAPALTNSILPWAVVNNGAVVRFATHGGDGTSLAPRTTGYTAAQTGWTGATINALPTADQTLSTNRTAGSLTLDAGIDLLAPTADRNFTLGSGGIGAVLQTGGASIIGATGANEQRLLFGTNEAVFHILGDLTIQRSSSSTANVQGTGGLTKTGAGTLTITISSITGAVRLNEGSYRSTAAAGLGGAAATLEFNGGGLVLAADAAFTTSNAGGVAVNANALITIDRAAAGAGVTHVLAGALTIGNQTLTVAKGSLVNADSAYGLTFSNTATGVTLTGSPTFVVNNNGTGTGTINLDAVNSSGGTHTIIKQGTGNLMMSGTTGFQNMINVQGGQIGWSNNTAAINITESNLMFGVGGVLKSGASTVNLTNSNSYTGATTITGGVLQALDGTGLPTSSNLVLNGGVFQSSGTLTRSLGTGAGQVQWAAGVSGGFSAQGGALTVTLAGAPSPLVWDSTTNFITGAGQLLFGSTTADNVVTFTHDIDLNSTGGGLSRTVSVTDNTGSTTDRADLSGMLSNSGAAGGLTKVGNGVLRLTGNNTFTGPVTVTTGTLQFSTVSNNGGAASNLGQGTDGISLGGGTLSFVGSTSQSTNRGITLTASSTLNNSGTGGATLAYTGAITGASTTLTLTAAGVSNSATLNGGLTQTGTSADVLVNSGTWTFSTGTFTIADDFITTGSTAVINLNTTGMLNHLGGSGGTSGGFYVRDGGTANLNANDVTGSANGLDYVIMGDTAGAVAKLNTNTFNLTTPRLDVGDDLTNGEGSILGTGTITVSGSLNLYRGSIAANLAGAAAIVKQGSGTLAFSGGGVGLNGTSTTLGRGTLVLDYTGNNSEKLSNAALVTSQGALVLNGNASSSTQETIGGLTLATGASRITVNNGTSQTATLNLNAITRTAVGGTVDFVMSSGSAVIQTSTANGFGSILGGYAIVGGGKFAAVSAGAIQAFNSTAKDNLATWMVGDNLTDSTGYTGSVGDLTINSLRFDASGTSTVGINSGARLVIASGGILVTSNVGTGVSSVTGGRLVTGNGLDLIVHQNNTAATFTVASSIVGTGLTKSGPGVLLLSGVNTFSGQTSINEGSMLLSGGKAIGDYSLVSLRPDAGVMLDLGNTSETIGALVTTGAVSGVFTDEIVAIGTGTLTINNTVATRIYQGNLTGSGTIVKTGGGQQSFLGDGSGFAGTVVIHQGTLDLSEGALLSGATAFTVNGTGALLSDQDLSDNVDHIGNGSTITLNNSGGGRGLWIRNPDVDESRAETVGAITLGAGHNVIQADTNGGTISKTQSITLTADSLTRANHATLLIRGQRMDQTANSRGQIIFTTTATGSVGGGGAAASTTMSILPYMIGETGGVENSDALALRLGNSFVFAAAGGATLRPLNLTTEYTLDEAGYNALTGAALNNVRFATNPAAPLAGTATQINSLVLDSSTAALTVTGPASALNIKSGAILATTTTAANAISLGGFTTLTTDAGNDFIIYVTNAANTFTLDSALATATPLVKSGAGTLVLTNAGSTFTDTYFNQGLIQVDGLNKLGAGNLNFFGGGLRWATGSTFDASTRTITLGTGGGTFDTNGNDVSFANAIGNGGTGHLTKDGAGVLTLNAAVNFTGAATVTDGTLKYGVSAALPTTTNVTLNGGTLDHGAFVTTLGGLSVQASSTITGSANLTFTGDSSFGGGGDRTLTISNTGLTTLSGSVLTLADAGTTARTQTIAGTGAVTINGEIQDGTAAGSLTTTNTNTVKLNGLSTYTGATNIDNGILQIGVTNALPTGTALRLGTSTTAGTLDLNGFNQTIGSLTSQTNSTTATNNIIIDGGNTLTINGAVTLGTNTNASTTLITASGGGSLTVNSGGANFQVGAATTTDFENAVTANFSGLTNFTANLGAGIFRVGDTGAGNPNSTAFSTLRLATNNTITTASFRVGDGVSNGSSSGHQVILGSGTNAINADLMNIGTAGSGIRSGGNLVFDGADTTGTITIRASDGSSRATLNMVNTTGSTGGDMVSTVNFAGHTADVLVSTLAMAVRSASTGAATSTLTFDQGTLDVTTLTMASRTGAGTGNATAEVNLGDSVAVGTPSVDIGTINMAVNTSAGGAVSADLNITGGNVDIGTGSGTAINMANAGSGRTVTSTIDITGGTVTMSGNIIRTGGAGTENATITLDGAAAILNLGGFTIGSGSAPIAFVARQGTLRNINDLNAGGLLTKSTSGTLLMDGTNSYTGGTAIQEGIVIANGGANNRLGSGGLTLGNSTTSGILQLGNANGASSQTVTSLATSGTGTSNAIVGGNAANSTLTVDQSSATISEASLGGVGANQNNLNLLKSGAGTLTVNGSSTYTGTTSVTGGTLNLAGGVNGTPSLSVTGSGSTLGVTGAFAGGSTVTSVNVGNGSTLSLINAVGDKLNNLTSLTLGSASGTMSFLNLNVGDATNPDQATTDLLTLLAGGTLTLFAGNQITFNLTDAGLNPNSTYNLLALGSGWTGAGFTTGVLGTGDWILGGTPGGFTSITLNKTDTLISITTGNLITGSSYWRGLAGGGTDTTWNANANNWSQDKGNTAVATTIPGAGTDVIFQIDTASNAAVTTSLEQNFKINSLTFEADTVLANTPTSVTINSGTLLTNVLTVAPQASTDGIRITAGGPSNVTINSLVKLGTSQTWNVFDGASNLIFTNGISTVSGTTNLDINAGTAAVGTIVLRGANGVATYTGSTDLIDGRLILEGGANDRLPTGTALTMGNATRDAILQLGDATNGASNQTTGTLNSGAATTNSIVGGGAADSTLTVVQGSTGTFNGVIGGGGANENNIALVKQGSAQLTINGANTYTGGTTVNNGILQLGSAGSITGALTISATAGITATFDNNSRSSVLTGGITLGGANTTATPQITNTGGAGSITLGGNVLYDATNNPLGGSIAAPLNLGTAARTFTANDSATATTDLTISGAVTATLSANTTGVGLVLDGTGSGLLNGAVALNAGSTDSTTSDLTKNGTGTWTVQNTVTLGDNYIIAAGTFTVSGSGSLTWNTTGTADQDFVVHSSAGSTVNFNVVNSLVGNASTNRLFARDGSTINLNATNAITSIESILLGDNNEGIGNLVLLGGTTNTVDILDLGHDSTGEQGHVSGTGTLTVTTTLTLDNGSVSANLSGAAAATKDGTLTVTLSGDNSLTGTTLIREGALTADYATNAGTNNKIGTGNFSIGSTTHNELRAMLNLIGHGATASRQDVANLTVVGGPTQINLTGTSGVDNILRITGTLARTGGTVHFSLADANKELQYSGSTTNTNGILPAWMTLNRSDFLTISENGAVDNIVAASYTTQNNASLWQSNQNITNSAAFTGTVDPDCNTINSLRFDAAAASTVTIGTGSYLIVTSGGIMATANVGANASTVTGGSLISGTNEFFFHQNNTASTLTVDSTILGGAAITKTGNGVLVLSGTNNSTGAVVIEEGIIRFSGGSALGDSSSVTIRRNGGTANTGIEVAAGQSETIGNLIADTTSAAIILNTGSILTIAQSSDNTMLGVISGAGTLVKTGTATLILEGNSTMTGAVVVNAGTLNLSAAAGDLAQATSYTLNGAELQIVQDQSAAVSRISNTAASAITLNNTAGTNGLWLQRTAANSTATEDVGNILLGAGHNVITSTGGTGADTGTSTVADLLSDVLGRGSNRATLLVRGLALGSTATTNKGFIRFASGGQATLDGFEVGNVTNTGTKIKIIPWMIGQTTNTGLGNSFVTNVDSTTGLRPLATTEYINDSTAITGALTDNIRYTASAAITATPTAINSLVLDSGTAIALTGSAGSMEITSGAILAAGAGNHSIGGISAITTGGGRDYTIFTTGTGTVTINSALSSAVPLVKSGQGTLALTAAGTGNQFTDIYMNQGMVLADDLDRLGTGTLRFFGGGLKLAAAWAAADDISTKTWDINTGGGTLDVSLVTAGVILVNGIDDATVSASDTLNIFTRSSNSGSTGQLTIQGSSTFTGTVIVRNSGTSTVTNANGIVLNGDTNAAINGNLEIGNIVNINDNFDAVVALGASDQIVDTASITFRGASGENAYFKLLGFNETVAGISDTTGNGVIENREGETVSSSGTLTLNSSQDFSYNGFFRDVVGGAADANKLILVKQGTGTQTLSGVQIRHSGTTTISGGALTIQDVTNWQSAIVNDATLNINQTTGSRTHGNDISGTGSMNKLGAGTVVLSGGNSYSGQTRIEQGVLSISASNNLGDASATNTIRIANGAILQSTGVAVDLGSNRSIAFAGTGGSIEVTGTNALMVSGALSGDACHTLTKIGDGLLVLGHAANNLSFSGTTVVSAGTLQVGIAGTGQSGSGGITIVSGATLAGTGDIGGIVNLASGSMLQPGDVTTVGGINTTITDRGTLVFSGSASNFGSGSTLKLDVTTATNLTIDSTFGGNDVGSAGYLTFVQTYATTSGGSGHDRLVFTSANPLMETGAEIIVNPAGFTGQIGQIFNLIDWVGAISGFAVGSNYRDGSGDGGGVDDLDLPTLGGGMLWDVSMFQSYGIVVVVPEPSRGLLLLFGLLGLWMRRRR